MMAGFMALNALAIDSMLPALPHIGEEFGVADANRRQWVITAYLLGFGAAQIIYGPISDRYGRRPLLLLGVGIYFLFSLVVVLASSFENLLFMRAMQGIGAAATRVLVVTIVRDCYSGRQMARVMSLTLIVFLIVPILAPGIGQLVMLVVPWQWIFILLALFALCLFVWAAIRLPETLNPANRLPLSFGRVFKSFSIVVRTRMSIGYTVAMGLMLGAIFAFLNSAQQIFADVFGIPTLFPLVFALIAGSMAIASFMNSRIVERFGTRRLSHTAVLAFALVSAIGLMFSISGYESLLSFVILQSMLLFCFGLTAPNFGAMAMEPVGEIAGAASSVQGFITTLGGALIGLVVGQAYQGSTVPLFCGYLILSLLTIILLLFVEGRLFQAQHER